MGCAIAYKSEMTLAGFSLNFRLRVPRGISAAEEEIRRDTLHISSTVEYEHRDKQAAVVIRDTM